MVKVVEPTVREVIESGRGEASAAQIAGFGAKRVNATEAPETLEARIRSDFRVFLILGWRHLLNCDPTPAMLDMAWYLQHGPDRSGIMAFRGFSKSWITGLFALWLLYCDPQEKVLIESGALERAVASTNWCLMLILTWPLLAHLKPRPNQRQSSKAFDVGPATPEQSPSFHALGIGGQSVGFRASIIIADDVETDKNSITSTMREKIRDAVKEFDSVLRPGGRIKFLGTPHDEESLYNELPKKGYDIRIYPARYPNAEEVKRYGGRLAPFIVHQMQKLGPGCVGKSTMPSRFTDEDLSKRELSLGRSEFTLQFMLDTSMSDAARFPLKAADLMVMALDPRRAPEIVSWTGDPSKRLIELQPMGFQGDHYHSPILPPDVRYLKYNRIVGAVDNSGRGKDETALCIVGELNGVVFLLHLWAGLGGFAPGTLKAIADACVRFRVQELRIEANFGDGMFAALLLPVLEAAWKAYNKGPLARGAEHGVVPDEGGTSILEVRSSNLLVKEKRILAVLEPITQSHRLVVNSAVIEFDLESIHKIDAEGRHRYSLMHQFTHLTREKDSLDHDDRVDSLAMALGAFADILGVDPHQMAIKSAGERDDEEYERLFGDLEEQEDGTLKGGAGGQRAVGLRPTPR